jgi:hypothetical protein
MPQTVVSAEHHHSLDILPPRLRPARDRALRLSSSPSQRTQGLRRASAASQWRTHCKQFAFKATQTVYQPAPMVPRNLFQLEKRVVRCHEPCFGRSAGTLTARFDRGRNSLRMGSLQLWRLIVTTQAHRADATKSTCTIERVARRDTVQRQLFRSSGTLAARCSHANRTLTCVKRALNVR